MTEMVTHLGKCATAQKRQIPSSGITKNDSWWKGKKGESLPGGTEGLAG